MHLVALNADKEEVSAAADETYAQLLALGYDVLFDDRLGESAGVKFNDADLLGLPVRVVISPRNLKNGVVEIKRRRAAESTQVPAAELSAAVAEALAKDEN